MQLMPYLATAAVALLMAGAAHAQAGQWTGRILGSADFAVGGNVHQGAVSAIPNLGVLNPALNGVPGTLDIGARSQSNIYGEAWGIGAELGYGVSNRGEVFGSVRFSDTSRGQTQVGVALVPALNASLPVTGNFGPRQTWAFEAGYRHYLNDAPTRFYVGGRAGVAFLSSVDANFGVPAAEIFLPNVPFQRRSTLFTGGLDAGVAFDIDEKVQLIAESGIRYTGRPRGDDSALQTLGLAEINNTGARWDVPVRVGFGIKF